jgi:hypothetical protein
MKKIAEKFLEALLGVLLKYLEKLLNTDLDGDGKVG